MSASVSADGVPVSMGKVAAKVAGLDRYLPLHELSAYCGLSIRTLRDCLSDPTRPLPHYRLGDSRKILVRTSEFDAWIAAYRRTVPDVNVGKIVDEMQRVHVK